MRKSTVLLYCKELNKVENKEEVLKDKVEEVKEEHRPNKYASIIVTLIVAIFMIYGGQIIGAVVTMVPASAMGLPEKYNIFLEYACFIGIDLLVILYLLINKKDKYMLKKLSYKPGHFLIGLVIGGTLNIACAFGAMLHGDLMIGLSKVTIIGLLIAFILVWIQSTAEELVCRLFIYQRVKRDFKSALVPIIINSVFFGALHLGNQDVTVLAIVNIIIYGLFMSVFIHYFDGIWIVSAIHTSWNFMQNFILGLPNSGTPAEYSLFKAISAKNSFFYDVGFGVEGTVFCTILLTLGIVLIYFLCRKKKLATEAV